MPHPLKADKSVRKKNRMFNTSEDRLNRLSSAFFSSITDEQRSSSI